MSYFPTTHWSLILSAGHGSVDTARRALEELCQSYWYPLYAYSRSLGDGPEDAEDLTQGFFVELIEKNLVAKAHREKGRFRSFLLQSFKHHRSRHREKATAGKRGGGVEILSLEALGAEERYAAEPRDELTPERRFERNWAISVLDEAHRRLAADYAASGKEPLFHRLRGLLQSTRAEPYAALAVESGKSPDALKMEVSRMRARYRRLLREVVAETVDLAGEVEEELRYLLAVLST
jgi:DNA-directed RNA polymerase specialized sigma24 family protein